ncbi:putative transmembrane protein [Toxoplasma gondii RUB]|uniref:Transmembrane protein n=10 Tax=Toxoplasma gondii TaxID=5811 RepID=B9Q1F5_TOXGV|nr:hypothetical protein TGGT1_265340 [Toxoplasma gondii GT1]ESS33660.1 putative transmembrane protein [Toxoplasma gondii VEG]KAF4644221.1 hypothetical protein TGRH88_012130 [Toxoplasma gondii]KFG38560.1 putative transmembrane protein [Toxoplasma gondii GAB2-2007-GAL-DOM2]KFG42138.1 putative transmembrane protein [Toxoplasma gondii FOU]KFG58307.1 putative transmembrane protein [Toxoplasma gondii RUB]KFH01441.1 putative transmembrane protein [Toxoplasma gondii VAND]KFH08931.1 putative transmem
MASCNADFERNVGACVDCSAQLYGKMMPRILLMVVAVLTLSSLRKSAALRSTAPVRIFDKEIKTVLPVCSAVEPGSLHIGDSCLSDCGGACRGAAARPGFRLISDNEQVDFSQGCSGNEIRKICSVGVSNPGGYPLCEELDTQACGHGCSCWSTCTDHNCNPDALSAGFFFVTEPKTITPSGCLIDLHRQLCKAGITGVTNDFWIAALIILLIVATVGALYYYYR